MCQRFKRDPLYFFNSLLDPDVDFLAPDFDVEGLHGLDGRKPDGPARAHVKPSAVVEALQSITVQLSVGERKILM